MSGSAYSRLLARISAHAFMNKRLRGGARRLVSFAARLLEETESSTALEEEAARSPFDYAYVNLIHERIMARGGAALRANYLYGVLHAARLAKVLGIPTISTIEFGVAGGRGLLALEKASVYAEEAFGVGIDVYGFDTGRGLPKPTDFRDCPNLFLEGEFPLDEALLLSHLERAELVLGLVDQTVPEFMSRRPAPIGFVSFDLDLYSSTACALRAFEADSGLVLPRVLCYFDDITGFTYADHNGERLAISEFNAAHELRKVSPIYAAEFYVPQHEARALWPRKLYLAHILDHPRYSDYDGLVRRDAAGAGGAWSIT
jgi:hypothetical protein